MPELNGRAYTRVETCVPCGKPLGIDEYAAENAPGILQGCETIDNGYRCEGCEQLVCFWCDPQADSEGYVCATCFEAVS